MGTGNVWGLLRSDSAKQFFVLTLLAQTEIFHYSFHAVCTKLILEAPDFHQNHRLSGDKPKRFKRPPRTRSPSGRRLTLNKTIDSPVTNQNISDDLPKQDRCRVPETRDQAIFKRSVGDLICSDKRRSYPCLSSAVLFSFPLCRHFQLLH